MSEELICRACEGMTTPLWRGTLLDIQVQYYECPLCGHVQTEFPFWLDRAYSEPINSSDTGILVRNQSNVHVVLASLFALRWPTECVVDYAGGYGILVRLLRDAGVNALWSDLYCPNLLARGFEYKGEPASLVTAFEAFEHFCNPAQEFDRLLAIAPNVLLSTEIIPDPAPPQDQWWYYGRDHGQHIGFFRYRTLRKLAESRGKHLASDRRSYHLITDKPINGLVWNALVRGRRLVGSFLKLGLKSKTWDDHYLMSCRRHSG